MNKTKINIKTRLILLKWMKNFQIIYNNLVKKNYTQERLIEIQILMLLLYPLIMKIKCKSLY